MSKGKFYFSKSLEKGLKILALFNRDTPVLTQSEVARQLGMNMTSTYRYINTLVELGYLEKNARSKEIRPSIFCLSLCSNLMQSSDHLGLIRETVNKINREHNITIDVALAVEDSLVRIYHRQAEEALTYSLPDFSKNCLHNTALGKAYLASLPEDQLTDRVEALELTRRTPKTITDSKRLLEEIRHTRKRRYALADEEYLPGVLAIAAPLHDGGSGRGIGAVSFDFSILQHDIETIVDRYADMIQHTARTLSTLMPPKRPHRE